MAPDGNEHDRRRRGPSSRLPGHRAVLALGLLAAGPALVLHDGWRGLLPAVAGASYAGYLLAGKRWPHRSRPVTRARSTRPLENSHIPGPRAIPAAGGGVPPTGAARKTVNRPVDPPSTAEAHPGPDPSR